jgi:hypothetical protein
MMLAVATLARWASCLLHVREVFHVRRAEREITRFLDLLGGSSISSEVKESLIADYLANRPLAIHASQLGPAATAERC